MKIDDKRIEIDKIDSEIRELFQKRMKIAKEIGEIKKASGQAIEDKTREIAMIEKNLTTVPKELKQYYKELLEKMIELSKRYQNNNL